MMSFREATGNYHKDRFSPVVEAIINIFVSILFVKKFGVSGVFMGTIISSLCTNFWLEPLIVSKKSLTITLKNYFIKYFNYLIVLILSTTFSYYICTFISVSPIIALLLKALISVLIPILFIVIIYRKDNSMIYYKNFIKKILKIK